MRKIVKAGLAGIVAAVALTGCGAKDSGTGSGTAAESSVSESGAEEGAAEEETGESREYIEESSITLGEYKNLKATTVKATVSEEELNTRINTVLGGYATYEPVEREAAEGDQVNIDYVGTKGGVAFEGGTDAGYNLVLGSGSFIPGFEDGLIGGKKGEERSLNLTFPENYGSEELAGQDVVFQVTINEVKELHRPELTDEFVAENFPESGTAEAYKEALRADMLASKQESSNSQRDAQLLNQVVEGSEIVCSTASVDEIYNQQVDYYTTMASLYGMELSDYAMVMGMDEDSFKAELRSISEEAARQQLVLDAIAEAEGLTVSDKERKNLADEYGYESVEAMIEQVGEENVDRAVLSDKAMQVIVDNAVMTEVEGLAVDQ